ncbi:hypothetical protein HMPREF9622_02026 [Cutibacterium modestum HL037PA3]|uniref:Uncharacterized protein n=1 Tax=Cutibacterium modestum HL044PA1 TaxID=765109 RepID=A0ABN0C6M1_9ACTN|nr:hypothetical protein HMPREF9621_02735 [Cutibacterium modestum HL037PA2]EFS92927.1 hypothetical protein HMPREF9607_00777 [Cutibacterium modestum HL044PA1]EFT15058.1 hypothetical protein HMPREF9622_02026 [Cutibacterium modestum HL037PA3]
MIQFYRELTRPHPRWSSSHAASVAGGWQLGHPRVRVNWPERHDWL